MSRVEEAPAARAGRGQPTPPAAGAHPAPDPAGTKPAGRASDATGWRAVLTPRLDTSSENVTVPPPSTSVGSAASDTARSAGPAGGAPGGAAVAETPAGLIVSWPGSDGTPTTENPPWTTRSPSTAAETYMALSARNGRPRGLSTRTPTSWSGPMPVASPWSWTATVALDSGETTTSAVGRATGDGDESAGRYVSVSRSALSLGVARVRYSKNPGRVVPSAKR